MDNTVWHERGGQGWSVGRVEMRGLCLHIVTDQQHARVAQITRRSDITRCAIEMNGLSGGNRQWAKQSNFRVYTVTGISGLPNKTSTLNRGHRGSETRACSHVQQEKVGAS
jgi:hypothetical protein